MIPLTLISVAGNQEDKIHDSILITDRATGHDLAQIFADGIITPNPLKDLYSEAFDTFVLISNNFYLFFNNIKPELNGINDAALEIIKDETEKSNVRQYTCINGAGYSQVERNIADRIIKLFLLFIVIAFCSCKSKKEIEHDKLAGIYKHENDKKYPSNHDPDTSIHQAVWLYRGQYILQTVVKTERQQNWGSSYSDFQASMSSDSWVQYNREIAGSFDYIKSNKLIEYNKADSFIKDLRLKAARDSIAFKATLKGKMTDSAEVLNKMPLYRDSIIKTDNRALDGISTDKGIYKYENPSNKKNIKHNIKTQ